MIIDSHVHILNKQWLRVKPTNIDLLIEDLKKNGVDKAILSSIDGLVANSVHVHRTTNDQVSKIQNKYKGIFYSLGTVNPNSPDAVDEVRRCYEKLGLKGLKLHPWLQAFSLTSPGLYKVCKESERLKIPIMFHDGTPPYSAPSQFLFLAYKLPELKIIFAHSGLNDLWHEAVDVAVRFPNISLCICGTPLIGIRKIAEKLGSKRILFGTDAGFGSVDFWVKYHLQKVDLLGLNEIDRENILARNAIELFGI